MPHHPLHPLPLPGHLFSPSTVAIIQLCVSNQLRFVSEICPHLLHSHQHVKLCEFSPFPLCDPDLAHAPTNLSCTQEKANLARIRDNQRRSRARRKEYLQELEGKFRNCELLGVEASSEIQSAARRVAEENKRLRALLRARGVGDAEVDEFLGRPTAEYPQFPSAVAALDAMLKVKKPCRGETPGCSRQGSEASSSNTWEPGSGLPLVQDVRKRQEATPLVTANLSTDSVVTPYTQASDNGYVHSGYVPLDPTYPTGEWAIQDGQSYDLGEELAGDGGTSSCNFAASIITGMRGGVKLDRVKQELGCAPGVDCTVDSSTLFTVMDHYSGQPLGL